MEMVWRFECRTYYIGLSWTKFSLAPLSMPKRVWPSMNWGIMFFVQTSTDSKQEPRTYQTWKASYTKQPIPNKGLDEIKDNSINGNIRSDVGQVARHSWAISVLKYLAVLQVDNLVWDLLGACHWWYCDHGSLSMFLQRWRPLSKCEGCLCEVPPMIKTRCSS